MQALFYASNVHTSLYLRAVFTVREGTKIATDSQFQFLAA